MFGFSIFLNEALTNEHLAYIQAMKVAGFKGIFSSIHIPEEENGPILERLQSLGAIAKEHGLELVIDISGNALAKLGLDFDNVFPLVDWGITGLRMDYGISNQVIAGLSQHIKIALNASTLTQADVSQLKAAKADFTRMEAWHNYYPRPETGLGSQEFELKNLWLQAQGFTVMAFVPGDQRLRGPLYETLPTLEKHRGGQAFVAALEMVKRFKVDHIYIGDPQLSAKAIMLFETYIKEDVLTLPIRLAQGITPADDQLIKQQVTSLKGRHSNRLDGARDVIRSAEARLRKSQPVKALSKAAKRPKGTITIDNEAYERYAGEVQVTKRALKADERVNVLGHIQSDYRDLVNYCGPGQKFEFDWEEKE